LDHVTGSFDAVITMGCGDQCPWIEAKLHQDWALPDPKHMDDVHYRLVRDDISNRVQALLQAIS
jgi:arsenate reductase (thioredoxin)